MNKTVEVSDGVYEQLERQAQALGITVAEAIAQVWEEAEAARSKAFGERLEAKSLAAKRKPDLSAEAEPFQPIHEQGKPLAEVIREERS